MRLLKDLDVSGKKVFLRADLDVPIETTNAQRPDFAKASTGKLTTNAEGATRLTNLKPTVEYLLGHGAKQIIIAGHIDRPESPDPALSTKRLVPELEKILGRKIAFVPDLSIQSKPGLEQIDKPGFRRGREVFLLENLRFWPGEEANDFDFARKLAQFADVYVNEAFGNCHRAHASMVALPALLPQAAGLHLQKEVEVLSGLLSNPKRPFVAIVGGAKIETKVPVVENLAKIADYVLVGGEIAKELKVESGKWKVDENKVIVSTLAPDTKDIDEESIEKYKSIIASAKTVVWNGPMGVFEEGFEKGTMAIAGAIIDSEAYSVVGGGETTQFLAAKSLLSRFSFVSSGGGAMLEFLSGKKLPGIVALE